VKPARKPGKPSGAPGVGRTQVFTARDVIPHSPEVCAGCGRSLTDPVGAVAYTGFQEVDRRWAEPDNPGLQVGVVDHRYYEAPGRASHPSSGGPRRGGPAAPGGSTE
jgi:hypothetical protein